MIQIALHRSLSWMAACSVVGQGVQRNTTTDGKINAPTAVVRIVVGREGFLMHRTISPAGAFIEMPIVSERREPSVNVSPW